MVWACDEKRGTLCRKEADGNETIHGGISVVCELTQILAEGPGCRWGRGGTQLNHFDTQ